MEIQVDIKAIADCLQVRKVSVLKEIIIVEDIFLLAMMFESCIFSYGFKSFNICCSKLVCMVQKAKLMPSWKSNFPMWMQMATEENL